MTFNKKGIKTRCKNWVFIIFFLKGELSIYCYSKPIGWHFKLIVMRNYLEYLARLMRGKFITIDEACDLLDIASQKIQAL